jgi:hypothetical protein
MQREMEVVVADHRAEVSALKDKIAALGAPQGACSTACALHGWSVRPSCHGPMLISFSFASATKQHPYDAKL